MRSGHISGSINVPFTELIDQGCMKNGAELREILAAKGLDLNKQALHSCNSGVTACIVQLAWKLSGGGHSVVYDGSWSEYVSPYSLYDV